MKYIVIITTLLFTSVAFACSCDSPNPALEFYDSEYVFERTVISKIYAKNFQTYTVTFDISRHYKNGATPETLSFILKSESKYTNEWTSCDWSVQSDQKWLVYAYLGNDELLNFDGICSNSRRIDCYPTNDSKQKILDNGNDFVLGNYIYRHEYGFTHPKPITEIDSIIELGKKQIYKNTFAVVKMYVDKNGNLQGVINSKNYSAFKIDKIFNLPYEYNPKEKIELSEFEKEAIEVAKKIKKWEIKYHKKTGLAVAYITSIIFQYDTISMKWSYEL
ncbi:hypothetical protein IMCC3317_03330 [Kordia antarctica]|uniref:Uncharacterized protein n=1 Tax=Kordia antarctica TaxID=1218801 RepID=A0A7L4ZEH9_9FLAO|nr:hypothetical protein [Kordia antarctica]QHI34987.1 hypothetical protein IMCC3317_03330 [Kordia antarctica]